MSKLPKPPAEVPVRKDVDLLAPKFKTKIQRLLLNLTERGHDPIIAETMRDDERQKFLHGFGRLYDDGRGVVTKASTSATTWHGFGLAVDIVSRKHGWNAPAAFWTALGEECRTLGLCWGNDWDMDGIPVERDPDESFGDRPHVQWAPMRRYPSPAAKQIRDERGLEGLWRYVEAA
jgi:hypothetical protein